MNLRGQWATLKEWQKKRLIHHACIRNWHAYWYLKKQYLLKNLYDRNNFKAGDE